MALAGKTSTVKGTPANESAPRVGAIVAQEIIPKFRKLLALLAHRLRVTQSPPTNADVRPNLELFGTDARTGDTFICGAERRR